MKIPWVYTNFLTTHSFFNLWLKFNLGVFLLNFCLSKVFLFYLYEYPDQPNVEVILRWQLIKLTEQIEQNFKRKVSHVRNLWILNTSKSFEVSRCWVYKLINLFNLLNASEIKPHSHDDIYRNVINRLFFAKWWGTFTAAMFSLVECIQNIQLAIFKI